MEDRAGITLSGQWVVRLICLFTSRPYHGEQAMQSRSPGPEALVPDAQPATMQTIARVSAAHQEKLGLNPPFFTTGFGGRC